METNSRRKILTHLTSAVIGAGAMLASIPFIASLKKPEHRTKQIYKDVDITKLEPGQMLSVTGMDRPIYILKRTQTMLDDLLTPNNDLLDPYSNNDSSQPKAMKTTLRSLRPDIFVADGLCTHLGCSVAYHPPGENTDFGHDDDNGLFFCPCHGAKYDLAGRVVKNVPAPKNLVIPNYRFLSDNVIRLELNENG